LLVVALFVPRDEPVSEHKHSHLKSGQHPLLETLKSQYRLLIPAGLGQVFAQTIRVGRTAIIPLYAADVIGLDVEAIGLLTTIAAGLEMTMFYPAGWVMDNLGRKWAVVPSFAIQALAMACVPLTHSFAGLLICTSIIGLANGLSSGSMMTLGADLAPSYLRGEFLGVWRLIGDVGGTGGPAIVGGVADLVTLPAAALSMSVAGLLAALVFGLLLPETLKRNI
jgi:MFS family permease